MLYSEAVERQGTLGRKSPSKIESSKFCVGAFPGVVYLQNNFPLPMAMGFDYSK